MENEKRLIDANAALEKVCENCCCDFEECKQVGFCVDYTNIEQLPTVDAVEVVHGHWTTLYKVDTWMGTSTIDCFLCSECGVMSKRKGNYCPNCGANMRGDNK